MSNKVSPDGGVAVAFDLVERDPKTIHDPKHFQVDWDEVFAEPDPGVHSFNGVWKCSYLCFSYVRLWTYRILSIFGVISACCFGLEFGCTACYMIWCCEPCLKLQTLQCIPIRKILFIIMDCCISPFVHALSMLFWNIRVTMAKDDGKGQTQDV